MTIYAMIITYNFDGESVTRGFHTEEEAIKCMNEFLNHEIEVIRTENGYEPLVQRWNDDDVTLVYAPCDDPVTDKAFYRVHEIILDKTIF